MKRLTKLIPIIVVLLLGSGGVLMAQDSYNLNLNLKDATIKEIIDSFKQQTGVVFSSEASLLDKKIPAVKVALSGASLDKCVEAVFAGTGVTYRVSDKMVALSGSPKAPQAAQQASTGKGPRARTGVVVDYNGDPIPGAAVMISGKTTGAGLTDENGQFSIMAADNEELSFMCLGYETRNIQANSSEVKRVVLREDAVLLEGTVVTALGIKRDEKAIGYSVTKVESEKFANAGTTGNWLNGMTGQVAGLNIDRTNSGPNGSMRVTVRGESTADLENNTALFVIDGVPMYNTATMSDAGGDGSSYAIDYGNGTADVDPDNIESVTVLKGAAATALYGSQAANGAIIITTKDASSQESNFQVSFKSSWAMDKVLSSPDLQYVYGQGSDAYPYYYYLPSSADEDVSGINPRADYSSTSSLEQWGPKMDGTPYYQYYNIEKGIGGHVDDMGNFVRDETPFISRGDWFKRYFETGLTAQNSLTLSGKINKDNNVRLSVSDSRIKGIVPNSPSRTNYLSLRTKSNLTKWMTVESAVNYKRTVNGNIPTSSGYGSTAIMYGLWCYAPNLDMEWAKDYWRDEAAVKQDASLSGGKNNPYFLAYQCINDQKRDRIYGNVKMDATITKGLTLTVRGGLDMTHDFRTQRQATSTQAKPDGFYREQVVTSKQYSADFLLRYNKHFGEFEFTGNIGGSIINRSYDRHDQYASTLKIPGVYTLANSTTDLKTFNSANTRQTNSLYGLFSLSWKNAIFLDITGRNDWSSTLKKGNRSYFYPSVSGSVALNDLFDFGRTNGLINLMKIRASWAQVGHDTAPYRIVDYLQTTGFPGTIAIQTTKSNTDLRPEIVTSWEVGLELKMFKNRFSLDAAYYDQVTKDLISQMPISYANGVSGIYINAGSIRNRGVEITANGSIIKTRNILWKVGVNWTKNVNSVISLGDGIDSWIVASYSTHAYMTAYEGGSLTCMYGKGYKRAPQGSTAIDAEGNMVDVSGMMLLDSQNLPQTDTELKFMGDCAPKWKGGFNTSFKWKGLTLSVAFDGQLGGHVFSYTNWVLNYRGKGIKTVEGREGGMVPVGVRETPDGNFIINTDAIPKENIGTYYHCLYEQTNCEANFVSTQFLKLRNVSLEYKFPKKLLAKTKVISDCSLTLYGSNIWCWTEFPGFDPEGVTMRGAAVIPGFDILQMPSSAQFGATLNIVF